MTAIQKNPHINKLQELVEEYNNTTNAITNMTPINVKQQRYTNFFVENKKFLNLKLDRSGCH